MIQLRPWMAVAATALISLPAIVGSAPQANAAGEWPNGPSDDPRDAPPNDPGFSGQWNLWSFVPEAWTQTPGFRTEEITMGTGIHADRAWQVTPGDRRVIVGLTDSGAYWDNTDLVNKYYLNRGELTGCKPTPMTPPPAGADAFDVDGSGWFDIRDYYAASGSQADELVNWDENNNGMIDPQDLIMKCSDGADDDGNGYKDDISGWDMMDEDNDAYDRTRFGHGNGEARDSVAQGNNGEGDIGVCPDCTVLMVRVGDSFVTDSNNFAQGVIFAVDSGVSLIQSALGAINNTALAEAAVEYAYSNNVALVASAADELSYHHNFPGSGNHSIYVHAIQYDNATADQSTTFLNFNNCTNYGMQLLLSVPGTGCSSEAAGIGSGLVGLLYSAALKANLDPPISAEEIKQVLVATVDDIDVNPLDNDPEKYPSGPGFDWHFGYGRPNARAGVDAIVSGAIPPEVDIIGPAWFKVLDPARTPTVDITGRINTRVDGKAPRFASVDWVLEYAMGVAPNDGWIEIATGTTSGMEGTLASWDLSKIDVDLSKRPSDPNEFAVTVRLRAEGTLASGTKIMGQHRKGFMLDSDPDLLPGFPIQLAGSAESSPIFADMDGKDDDEEIVLFSSDGLIHVFQEDGSELAGFPVMLDRRADMDPDNGGNHLNSCAFRQDKTGCLATVSTIDPAVGRQTSMMPVAVGDLDGDGTLEIIINTWDGWVFVFEHDGSMREGWPQSLDFSKMGESGPERLVDSGFFASPVLYDLDQQGGLEIISAAMDQYIYVWHADGTPMAPYPVRLFDPNDPESVSRADRIIATPAVGDIDGDGKPELACGATEVFGAAGVENEAIAYVLDAETGTIAEGWPQSLFGLTVNVLPVIGRGVVGNPMLADLDFDGTLEISLDTISTQGWIFNHDGEIYDKMNNQKFGEGSDSVDSPAYILMNNGAFGNVDNEGGIDLVKGTAGFKFALTFAGGGKRGDFDHHMSGWDTDSGEAMFGFPRIHDDWQFFNAPSIVDLNNDAYAEVIIGSGGYLLHAWDRLGNEPTGWPKQTGGWIIASPGVGDLDGDGKFDVAISTREGWLYAWKTEGSVHSVYEWAGFGHDPHNTGNYETDPTPYQPWSEAVEPPVEEVEQDPDTSDSSESDTIGEDTGGTAPPPEDDGCAGGAAGGSLLWLLGGVWAVNRRRWS